MWAWILLGLLMVLVVLNTMSPEKLDQSNPLRSFITAIRWTFLGLVILCGGGVILWLGWLILVDGVELIGVLGRLMVQDTRRIIGRGDGVRRKGRI